MVTGRENLLRAAHKGALSIRDMQGNDLKQVLCIEANAQASPWGRISYEESLTKQHCCRVIEMDCSSEKLVGFEAREVVAYHVVCEIVDELHILNVVAAPQFQGLGLGHMLMDDIIAIAQARRLTKTFLEVRAGNKVAQDLYLKWQFTQIALRKKYYRPTAQDNVREDAFVYMRKI